VLEVIDRTLKLCGFPDYPAPVIRDPGDGREMAMMRWGMPPPPPCAGGYPVTNIRNTTSPHWRGWLM
jgi:putative SOS response-associated peptidase YedK